MPGSLFDDNPSWQPMPEPNALQRLIGNITQFSDRTGNTDYWRNVMSRPEIGLAMGLIKGSPAADAMMGKYLSWRHPEDFHDVAAAVPNIVKTPSDRYLASQLHYGDMGPHRVEGFVPTQSGQQRSWATPGASQRTAPYPDMSNDAEGMTASPNYMNQLLAQQMRRQFELLQGGK